MNKLTVLVGAAGTVLFLAGCGPELAQVSYGAEEARWQEVLRENYSGYKAPRTAPPAIEDNVSPRLIEEERLRKIQSEEAAPAQDLTAASVEPADDPGAAVDNAAAKAPEAAPVAEDVAVKAPEATPAADDAAAKAPEADKKADEAAVKAPEADKDSATGANTEYVVKPGDNLGKIAKQFYGDARRFDVIVKANPALAANPNLLRVGMKLVIPKI